VCRGLSALTPQRWQGSNSETHQVALGNTGPYNPKITKIWTKTSNTRLITCKLVWIPKECQESQDPLDSGKPFKFGVTGGARHVFPDRYWRRRLQL